VSLGSCDLDSSDSLSRYRSGVPADEWAAALGIAVTKWHGDEDRVRNRLWKPPTSKLCGGQRRERRAFREDELPGMQHLPQGADTRAR
jgi:hypothetical protein